MAWRLGVIFCLALLQLACNPSNRKTAAAVDELLQRWNGEGRALAQLARQVNLAQAACKEARPDKARLEHDSLGRPHADSVSRLLGRCCQQFQALQRESTSLSKEFSRKKLMLNQLAAKLPNSAHATLVLRNYRNSLQSLQRRQAQAQTKLEATAEVYNQLAADEAIIAPGLRLQP